MQNWAFDLYMKENITMKTINQNNNIKFFEKGSQYSSKKK